MDSLMSLPPNSRIRDLTGQTFGYLQVLGLVGFKWRNAVWRCKCRCGTETDVKSGLLVRGHTRSCGCYKIETIAKLNRTHGFSGRSKAYSIWCGMKTRCYNENRKSYKWYGERGIKVCDRWLYSFEAFLEDMGEPEAGQSLDRIDGNGNYEPANCRWASAQEQACNTKRNRYVTVNGEMMNVKQAATRYGISEYSIYARLNRGLTNEDAVFGKVR